MKTIAKKDKKQQILDAALMLFSGTHDVKKVSIEAIAKQARVSPTTIYNNFGTREKLVYEVIKLLFDDNGNGSYQRQNGYDLEFEQ